MILFLIALFVTETFFMMDAKTGETLMEIGPSVDERISPCSTFKIPLSLMGYDAGILEDENRPVWPYQEGFDDFLESWKKPQTPISWMRVSCVWYSKILYERLGLELVAAYLKKWDYGNQDLSGGSEAWICSSLKISPREQVQFLQKIVSESSMTKKLLWKELLPNGWIIFGKTGWSGRHEGEFAWLLGWIEKEDDFCPFAYLISGEKIDLDSRIPRVKELIGTLEL